MIIVTAQYVVGKRQFSSLCRRSSSFSNAAFFNSMFHQGQQQQQQSHHPHSSTHNMTGNSFNAATMSPLFFTAMRFAARATHSEITSALNVLGVTMADTKDPKAFKKKYIELVRKNHPDKGGSEEKMKNITTAYDLLSNLSEYDKKEFGSRNKYSGGSTNTARNQAYQQRAYHQQQAYDFQDMYRRQYESSGSGSTGRTDYSTYQGQTQTNDPFGNWRGGQHTGSGQTTGSYARGMYNARRLPNTVIFFRAMVVYSVIVMFVVIMQRASDDYTNQSGWAAASKQARQDRLEQIFESRQEFMDKLRSRDLSQRVERERQKEKKMYDYAAQRQAELNRMEFGSFPPLPQDGRLGSVFKIPADPVGILYYEPPMANSFESAMLPPGALSPQNPQGGVANQQLSGNMRMGSSSSSQQQPDMQSFYNATSSNPASSSLTPPGSSSNSALGNSLNQYQNNYATHQPLYSNRTNQPNSSSSFSGENISLREKQNAEQLQQQRANLLKSQVAYEVAGAQQTVQQQQKQQKQYYSAGPGNYNNNAPGQAGPGNTEGGSDEAVRRATPLSRQVQQDQQGNVYSNPGVTRPGVRYTTSKRNVERNDPQDYNPELDSFGHEGMVAAAPKPPPSQKHMA